MEPGSLDEQSGASTSVGAELTDDDRQTLRRIASDSIAHGLRHGQALPVNITDFSDALQHDRATFVTIKRGPELRGCIGVLEARRPLVEDVAENAYAAAFRDPRFPPLRNDEANALNLHISVLSPPRPLQFTDESDAKTQLRPGIDGVILEDSALSCRGTFLPAVWETLPSLEEFWRQLKVKAKLPPDHWSNTMNVWRYTAESID